MSSEPTVEVKLDPCPDCQGKGSLPPRVEPSGMSRSIEAGGVCGRCSGKGKISRNVPLGELRALLDHPDAFP